MPLNTLANMESLNLKGKSWDRNWENNNASSLPVKKGSPLSTGKLFFFVLSRKFGQDQLKSKIIFQI